MTDHYPVVVIGAGPAGLATAHELTRMGLRPLVVEERDKVGGLARTETYEGCRFDMGGHRFYTKATEVQRLWEVMLGQEFVKVPRLSRIYYRGHFFNYPLDFFNALSNLGLLESLFVLLSYLKARVQPYPQEDNFEQWVSNRFGRRLYRMFFKIYTEKVWGIPCHDIRSDWAAQRIKGLSLLTAVFNALFGTGNAGTLISEFHYPRLGPGMMWQRFQEVVEGRGAQVWLGTQVLSLSRREGRITEVIARREGEIHRLAVDQVISSMPLAELIHRLDPPPPEAVAQAAHGLHYRAFLLVGLIVEKADLFPDNWIYVHSPEVRVGRIQNFRNWSTALVPDSTKTSLGMEYFCTEGDDLWTMPDARLIELATGELARLGLADAGDVVDGVVFRQPKAYPVYDQEYRAHLQTIQSFLSTIENLQTIGRNGMHRYNNQDHSMLTGMLAARNLLGESHDLWQVNTETSYYEEAMGAATV